MRLSSLIGHIAELLHEVQQSREPADAVTARFFRARRYLGARDRRFIADHLFGILREQRFLEAVSAGLLGAAKSGSEAPRIPPLALVLVRMLHTRTVLPEDELERLRPLWNDLAPGTPLLASGERFEEVARTISADPDPLRRVSTVFSLPEGIVREWMERYGEQETEELCRALNEPAPTTARVNTLRCTVEECQAALAASGVRVHPGRHAPDALIFAQRPAVQTLEPFRRGWFEMQDEGSQLISLLLNPLPGELVVDVCAGAGGKSLHCAAMMGNRGKIVATDRDRRKLERLRERAQRAGASIIEVTPDGDLRADLSGQADAVLVDAPCSGVGTLRRNPGAKAMLSEEASRSYAETQFGILRDSAALVRPGGRLVYATCTMLWRENEGVVERFCAAQQEFRVVPVQHVMAPGTSPGFSGPFLTLTPHHHGTDGFFGAVLRRRD